MKKAYAVFLAALTAAAVLAGCMATPDEPIVVQKDMEQMIDKALKTPEAQASGTQTVRVQLGAPERLKTELVSAKGKLKIHADAEIIVPDVTAIPAVHVGMGAFTQDDVKRLYDTLCANAMPVDAGNTQITQGFKMRSIQDLLDQKQSGKLDDMKYNSMEELDAAIQQTMEEAQGLPEHFTRAEPDFSLVPHGNMGSEAHIRVAPDDDTLSEMFVINAPEGMGASRAEYCRDLNDMPDSIIASGRYIIDQTDSPYYVPPSMNGQDARKLAEDAVAGLGLSDFVCSGHRIDTPYDFANDAEDAPRKGVYEFMFTRQIGGVTITYTNDDGNEADVGDSAKCGEGYYAMPWNYEKVRIIVDDQGILCLLWNSPYAVNDILTDSSAMKPFSEIQSIFENMMPVVDNIYDTSEQGLTCDMYITELRLGLMRVTEKDIGTSGLLIPVWDFMGYTEDSEGEVYGKDGYNSQLTINAIDGSIINRAFGY